MSSAELSPAAVDAVLDADLRPPVGVGWRRPAILLALLAAATWLLLPRLLHANPLEPLLSLRWPFVALAVVAQGASQWGRSLLVHGVCAGNGGTLSRRRAVRVLFAASSVGLLGGGFAGYAGALYRWTRAGGASVAGALMASWLPSLLFSAAVVLIATASGLSALSDGFLNHGEWLGAGVGLLLVLAPLAALGWGVSDPARGHRLVHRLEHAWSWVRRRPVDAARLEERAAQLGGAWRTLRRDTWASLTGFALLSALCDAASVVLLLDAARVPLRVGAAFAAWGIPHLLGNASLLPGGAGVVEATMAPFLTRLGVPAAQALLVVLAYRGLAFWTPLLAGVPLIVWSERHGNAVTKRRS